MKSVQPVFLLLLFFLLFVTAQPAAAQTKPLAIEEVDENRTKRGLIPAPVVYYTPNTKFAFGASLVGYLKLRSKIDTSSTRLSIARLFTDFTTNRQTHQFLFWNIFTREENYLMRGEIRHRVFRDRFFGIGNATPDEAEEVFWYSYISGRFAPLKNIGNRVFIGPDFQIANYYDTDLNPANGEMQSQLLRNKIAGYDGGMNLGLGVTVVNDNRNNIAFPSSGYYLEASAHRFSESFGGDFNYNNYNFIASKYWGLKPDHVLAGNITLNLNSGEVPVQRLATAGGEQILRSYTRNRFLADNFAGVQAEYRFPLFWRLGMVAFAGAGEVFDDFSDTDFSTIKYSVGTGFRLRLLPEEKLHSRLDIGLGREGIAISVGLGEAF
ncbi:BamA/TamA family outer membrane protein [Pontibacter toksunensis]|uniref:BamA/TamA family outer membrane protein n=1 Tax=Pontibacter toksunensis TaxID=1332631 RepID=A0ABW6BVV8_9BACT